MTWEGTMLSGQQAIVQKLQTLPAVRHEYPTLDIQPSTSGNAMIIFVQGKIQVRFSPSLFPWTGRYGSTNKTSAHCISHVRRSRRTRPSSSRRCSSSSRTSPASTTFTTTSSACSTAKRAALS